MLAHARTSQPIQSRLSSRSLSLSRFFLFIHLFYGDTVSTSGKKKRKREKERGRKRKEKKKKEAWVGHVSLHFSPFRRITRELKHRGPGTLCSVAELAGDFIEVDLDRSVRPEERLRAKEEPLSETGSALFFFFCIVFLPISFRWLSTICYVLLYHRIQVEY